MIFGMYLDKVDSLRQDVDFEDNLKNLGDPVGEEDDKESHK